MKPSTSNCQVEFDSVEKRRSYRLFNVFYQTFCAGTVHVVFARGLLSENTLKSQRSILTVDALFDSSCILSMILALFPFVLRLLRANVL